MKNNEIYIWDIDWVEYQHKKDDFYQLLSTQEKNRTAHYQFAYHQNQFILTRAILRILIGYLLHQTPKSIMFEYTPLGKPKLAGNNSLYFSVTHAQHKAIYAFCKHPDIGVDVEYQRNLPFEAIAARYFSTQENQILNSLQIEKKQDAFFKGWVQKEAISKAVGLGLHLPFNQIEVCLTHPFPSIIALPKQLAHSDPWYLNEIKTSENFKAVVAVRTPYKSLFCTQFTQVNPLTYLEE